MCENGLFEGIEVFADTKCQADRCLAVFSFENYGGPF